MGSAFRLKRLQKTENRQKRERGPQHQMGERTNYFNNGEDQRRHPEVPGRSRELCGAP